MNDTSFPINPAEQWHKNNDYPSTVRRMRGTEAHVVRLAKKPKKRNYEHFCPECGEWEPCNNPIDTMFDTWMHHCSKFIGEGWSLMTMSQGSWRKVYPKKELKP